MIKRRHLVQLLAVAPVAAALPAAVAEPPLELCGGGPPELWQEPYSFTPVPRFVRGQVLGPKDLFLPCSKVVQVRRFEIRDSKGDRVGTGVLVPGLSAHVEGAQVTDVVYYAGLTVPAEAAYGMYSISWHLEIRGREHFLVHPFFVVEDDMSRYSVWRAPEVGEFVIAFSAEDAALRYRKHIDWQGTMPQDLGLRPEEWEQWPADKVFPLTEEVDEAEAEAAHEAAKYVLRDYVASCERAARLWSAHPGKYEDYPGWKDQAWLFDDEKWPEGRPRPQVIWHIQRRNSKENPEAKNLIWGRTTRMLPAEWVAKNGPGYLGSTEC